MQFPFHKLLQFIHIKIQFPHRIAFPRWRSHILKQTFHFGKVRMFIFFLFIKTSPPLFFCCCYYTFPNVSRHNSLSIARELHDYEFKSLNYLVKVHHTVIYATDDISDWKVMTPICNVNEGNKHKSLVRWIYSIYFTQVIFQWSCGVFFYQDIA